MVLLELRQFLEEETGPILLIAGGFLLIQIAINDLPDLVGVSAREQLPAWAGFVPSAFGLVGLALPFVALFGLYRRLTSTTPRLAVVGGALIALTPILFLGGLLTVLLPPLPELPYLLWLSPVPSILGAGSFGVAFLRKRGPVRLAGVPLLVFAGTWALQYAVGLANGAVPGWLPSLELLAVSSGTMGYLLATTSTARNDSAPAGN